MSTVASIALRPKIREVMLCNPSQRWNEEGLTGYLNARVPGTRSVDVMNALFWNMKKGYVTSTYDEEHECDMWTITDAGKEA